MLNIKTSSSDETKKTAEKFAKKLRGGEVIALIGDLGAGKTTFVKGIAKGLGIKQNITSPTFVLIKEYQVECWKTQVKSLIHIDCYRMRYIKDALSFGITDYIGKKDVIVLIEWADKIS